ncbi:MAG: hypothetical protein MI748_08885 [Opitutales bacterium]|nr:hypothetical protein [Opitutales bacterium]
MKLAVFRTDTYRQMRRLSRATVILALIGAAELLSAQESLIETRSTFDWQQSMLELTISTPRVARTRNTPASSYYAQRELEERFLSRLLDRVRDVPVDSVLTVRDHIERDPRLAAGIAELAERAERGLP